MSKPARALRTLRRPPHRRHCIAVRVWGVGSKPGQAPLPPTAAAARPTNPSGGLHTGGAVSLCVAGTLTATP